MKEESLSSLKQAGLDRLHIGLESGNRDILRFQCKGQSPKVILQTGQWIKEAGIELSYYVLLGLGGADNWKAHIDDTAEILNKVDPEFIRIRRLWIYGGDTGLPSMESPLWKNIREETFKPQTPEGTVLELRRLVEHLEGIHSNFLCDHTNNYIQITGKFPEDKSNMLAEIDSFLSLPEEARVMHYEQAGSGI
jgi:histone acetyltransferase (RNA polymerase elongator complex component)